MINVSPFTKLYVYNAILATTQTLIKLRQFFSATCLQFMPVPVPQLRNSLLNALETGTNGNFGMGFSSTEAASLHDILFTLSSRSKKCLLRMCLRGAAKKLVVACGCFCGGQLLAAVTRTDVGGHFCGIAMVGEHANQCEQLSRCCPNKCISTPPNCYNQFTKKQNK